MQATIEQRADSRNNVSWPVSVWMPQENKFYNGRSCNISKTGVLITVPVTTPIQTGNTVELNFPRSETLAREKGQYARIKCGKVVRIDRNHILDKAEIEVGIEFNKN